MNNLAPANSRSGFSIVEVSIALLVAAVGLLSVMALFPAGMMLARKAADETQCALFAEEVFNGFRALMSSTNLSWSSIDTLEIGVPAPDMWQNGDQLKFKANGSGTLVYKYKYEPDMLDYALRYVMSVSDAGYGGRLKGLRLTLWNGEYGSTTNPLVYYTEIYDMGRGP